MNGKVVHYSKSGNPYKRSWAHDRFWCCVSRGGDLTQNQASHQDHTKVETFHSTPLHSVRGRLRNGEHYGCISLDSVCPYHFRFRATISFTNIMYQSSTRKERTIPNYSIKCMIFCGYLFEIFCASVLLLVTI